MYSYIMNILKTKANYKIQDTAKISSLDIDTLL